MIMINVYTAILEENLATTVGGWNNIHISPYLFVVALHTCF